MESETPLRYHQGTELAPIIFPEHVPIATHQIADVLAECKSPGSILASAEAEFRIRHEVLTDKKMMRSVGSQQYKV